MFGPLRFVDEGKHRGLGEARVGAAGGGPRDDAGEDAEREQRHDVPEIVDVHAFSVTSARYRAPAGTRRARLSRSWPGLAPALRRWRRRCTARRACASRAAWAAGRPAAAAPSPA